MGNILDAWIVEGSFSPKGKNRERGAVHFHLSYDASLVKASGSNLSQSQTHAIDHSMFIIIVST